MKRWLLAGLLAAVALASAFHVLLFSIGHMFDPRWGAAAERWQWAAAAAIAALTAVGATLIVRRAAVIWLFGVAVLIGAASFIPSIPEARLRREAHAESIARVAAYEARVLAEIEQGERDAAARIGERRPYQGEEARQFMRLVTRGDMTMAGGRNLSARTIAMLQRVLEAKVLDPNVIVQEPLRADLGPEPLFVNFYREARRVPGQPVLVRDWTILKLLAASGADLSTPAAQAVADDLRKTATPVFNGLYVELK